MALAKAYLPFPQGAPPTVYLLADALSRCILSSGRRLLPFENWHGLESNPEHQVVLFAEVFDAATVYIQLIPSAQREGCIIAL